MAVGSDLATMGVIRGEVALIPAMAWPGSRAALAEAAAHARVVIIRVVGIGAWGTADDCNLRVSALQSPSLSCRDLRRVEANARFLDN